MIFYTRKILLGYVQCSSALFGPENALKIQTQMVIQSSYSKFSGDLDLNPKTIVAYGNIEISS
jgi:hypothetical protein